MLEEPMPRSRVNVRVLVALLLAGSSCRSQSKSASAGTNDFAALRTRDADVRCVSDPTESDSVPFAVVDLGRIQQEAASQERILTGPRTRTVILDSLTWPDAWRAAVDTVPAPHLEFGQDALLLAATQTYGVGPLDFSVVAIRKCRATDAVVVGLREKARYPGGGEDYGSRGLLVIRVRRSALSGARVKFVDL